MSSAQYWKDGVNYYNQALEIHQKSHARKDREGFRSAMKYLEKSVEAYSKALAEASSDPDEIDAILKNLSWAYYLKGSCRYNIDGHGGDAVLKDFLKALDLDGQRLLRNSSVKEDMKKLLTEAFEGLYWAGEYKRGLIVCHYIEKYIDAGIIHVSAYKKLKKEFEAGSPLMADIKYLAKTFSSVSAWYRVEKLLDKFF